MCSQHMVLLPAKQVVEKTPSSPTFNRFYHQCIILSAVMQDFMHTLPSTGHKDNCMGYTPKTYENPPANIGSSTTLIK